MDIAVLLLKQVSCQFGDKSKTNPKYTLSGFSCTETKQKISLIWCDIPKLVQRNEKARPMPHGSRLKSNLAVAILTTTIWCCKSPQPGWSRSCLMRPKQQRWIDISAHPDRPMTYAPSSTRATSPPHLPHLPLSTRRLPAVWRGFLVRLPSSARMPTR